METESDLTPAEVELLSRRPRPIQPQEPAPVRKADYNVSQLEALEAVIQDEGSDEQLVALAKERRAELRLDQILAAVIDVDRKAHAEAAEAQRARDEKTRLERLRDTRPRPVIMTQPSKAERDATEAEAQALATDPEWLAQQEVNRVKNAEIEMVRMREAAASRGA
jgi:hypothetical protein